MAYTQLFHEYDRRCYVKATPISIALRLLLLDYKNVAFKDANCVTLKSYHHDTLHCHIFNYVINTYR